MGVDGKTELPFEQIREEKWAEAIDTWPWRPRGDIGWEKSEKCPRCDHPVTFVDTALVYAGFTTVRSISETSRKYASCDCGVQHPGAPEGRVGCGAEGLIERPVAEQA